MASVEKDRLKILAREMECPVCMEYMTTDIYQCENGHNVCGFCNRKLKECPYCTLPIVMRNRGLEKLARNLTYPCKYPGCNEAYCMDELRVHQSACPFGPFRCPMSCTFQGVLDDLLVHFLLKHSKVYSDLAPGKPLVNQLLDVRPRSCWDQVVACAGSVFFCSFIYSEDTLYGYVKQFGPPTPQSYGYEMSLIGADDKMVFTLKGQMHLSSETENDILKSSSCLAIGKELLQRYLDNKKRLKTTIVLRANNTQEKKKNLGAVPKMFPKVSVSSGAVPKIRPEKPITSGAIPNFRPKNSAIPKVTPEKPITSEAIPKVKPQNCTTSGNISNAKGTTLSKLKKSTILGFPKKRAKSSGKAPSVE